MELMTTSEAAELTRLPAGTLRYFRHRNEGPPSFRLGRRIVYRRDSLLQWIAEQESAERARRSA